MTTTATTPRVLGFLLCQLVLLSTSAAWCSWRVVSLERERQLPALRETPRTVAPLYDQPVVVSDEQLSRVLTRLRPKNLAEKTKVNNVDHALRFWGIEAKFNDPKFFDGEQLRAILTDERRFRELYGPDVKPLLFEAPTGGLRARVAEGPASSSHVDHTLAGLAEVGTPLSFPLYILSRNQPQVRVYPYRALLERALRDFSLNQVEYEWSALAFALFFEPTSGWFTSEGQRLDFNLLAERIMRQELPQGVCFGNHRLYTLAILLRVDEEHTPLFTPESRESIIDFLAEMTNRLVRHQHADGFWDGDWPTAPAGSARTEKSSGDPVTDRILATGHALEWWAMVPRSTAARLHPPRSTLAAAGQWIVGTVEGLTEPQLDGYYTFLTHAGRALALWRERWPHQVPLTPAQ